MPPAPRRLGRPFAALAALAALAGALATPFMPRLRAPPGVRALTPALEPSPARPPSLCQPLAAAAMRLGGPTPAALAPVSLGDKLVLYGAREADRAEFGGFTRALVAGDGASPGVFEALTLPSEPGLFDARFFSAALFRGEDALAVYSDRYGTLGVWSKGRSASTLIRLEQISYGFAAATVGEALVGAGAGIASGGKAHELVAVSFPFDLGSVPKPELIYRPEPPLPLASVALAAAGGRAVVAFRAGDRLLTAVLDGRARRRGEVIELARGDLGPPAVAATSDRSALVAWPERPAAGGMYRLRAAALPLDGGPPGPPHEVGELDLAASPPALSPTGEGAVATWSDGDGGHVVVRPLAADATPTGAALKLDAEGGARSVVSSPRPQGAWIAWIEGDRPARTRALALRCEAPAGP